MLQTISEIHQAALYDPAEPVTAASYAQVRRQPQDLPALIDPRLNAAEHAQALMFLHDTTDRALDLLPDDQILRAGVSRRLMEVYLSRSIPRSIRNATRLVKVTPEANLVHQRDELAREVT